MSSLFLLWIVSALSLRLVFKPLSLCLSPFAAPPPPLLQVATRTKKKKKNHINVLVLWVVCFYCECSLSTFGVQAFVSPFVFVCCSSTNVPGCRHQKKQSIALTCCEYSVSIVSTNRIKAPPLFHLHYCSSTIVSTLFLFFLSFMLWVLCFFFSWNTVNGSQRIMWQHRFFRTQNTYSI